MSGIWIIVKSENVKKADLIQKTLYENVLKPAGFFTKGRTFWRFTNDDLVQAVTLYVGRKYPTENYLFYIHFGICVPECFSRTFNRVLDKNKVYHDYDCNYRSSVGNFQRKNERYGDVEIIDGMRFGPSKYSFFYHLVKDDAEYIIKDADEIITNKFLPMCEELDTRDKILINVEKCIRKKRIDDIFTIMELDFVMIHGARGDLDTANKIFWKYHNAVKFRSKLGNIAAKGHLGYLDELAKKLGLQG